MALPLRHSLGLAPEVGVRSARAWELAWNRWELDLSDAASRPPKTMHLRYSGHCAMCGIELPVGTIAVYNSSTKSVTCLACLPLNRETLLRRARVRNIISTGGRCAEYA